MIYVVIYDYQHQTDELKSVYKPTFVYSEQSFVKKKKDLFSLSFDDLDSLKIWAESLIQEFEISELYLISHHDFNVGLDASSNAEDLRSLHLKYGEKLDLTSQAKDKGFFGKFFS